MCWCDDIVSIDQSKDDILIFVIVVTPYWHLPVDLSFLHEKVVVWWWWWWWGGHRDTQGPTIHVTTSALLSMTSFPLHLQPSRPALTSYWRADISLENDKIKTLLL